MPVFDPRNLMLIAGVIAPLVVVSAWAQGDSVPLQVIEENHAEPITPVAQPPAADAKSALGEALFADVRLSHDGQRSCATCHDLATNGASGVRFDSTPDGKPLQFNTPTVFNAALSFRQNWEGDLRTLEEQADQSIQSPALMGSTWEELLGKLQKDQELASRFIAAYGQKPTRESVLDALAAFERTLLTPDSRFDQWLRGDQAALSDDEKEGYRLFKEIGCSSCHQGVAIGANLFQKTNVFRPLFADRTRVMRVSSLRNVAVTSPYFDDGSSAKLEEAVGRMAQAQLGTQLKPDQVTSIVTFLKTLTGRYRGQELTAPQP